MSSGWTASSSSATSTPDMSRSATRSNTPNACGPSSSSPAPNR
jgi:hypothetical protein